MKDDRYALQSQLCVLVALAVQVVVGEQIFDGTMRDRMRIGWRIYAALKGCLGILSVRNSRSGYAGSAQTASVQSPVSPEGTVAAVSCHQWRQECLNGSVRE